MKFGVILDPHIEKWDLIRYAEELGYTRVGVGDSQMIWSDCYAVLTLAAVSTKRILLGTGVAIPGTRIAPVTAHSIATLNQLAPAGRTSQTLLWRFAQSCILWNSSRQPTV